MRKNNRSGWYNNRILISLVHLPSGVQGSAFTYNVLQPPPYWVHASPQLLTTATLFHIFPSVRVRTLYPEGMRAEQKKYHI